MDPLELYRFLLDRVADRGVSALRSVADFARDTHDLELKWPAMAALVCWGDAGLREIGIIAVSHPTSKNVSGALRLLATEASGNPLLADVIFVHDQRLIAAIAEARTREDLKAAARQQLNELVLSLPTDDLLLPLGTAFMHISLGSADAAAQIVAALSAKWLHFGPSALDRYEQLLRTSPNDEQAFHRFFVEYPQLLDPMATVVWSKPDFHGALEPDFIIQRADNSYLIVEIECPGKSLVTLGNQLTAEVTQAEKQAIDYRTFLSERIQEAQRHFPFVRDPDCLVVIGIESTLTFAQQRTLANANGSRQRLRIVGFPTGGSISQSDTRSFILSFRAA